MATFGKVMTALLVAVGAVVTAAAIIDRIYGVDECGGVLTRIWRRIDHVFWRCCHRCEEDFDFLREEIEDELADYRDSLEDEEEGRTPVHVDDEDDGGLKF